MVKHFHMNELYLFLDPKIWVDIPPPLNQIVILNAVCDHLLSCEKALNNLFAHTIIYVQII